MAPGTFVADPRGTRSLYVWLPEGDSPHGHVVEASARATPLAIDGSFVHVVGLTVRYAANRAQQGAIHVGGENNTLRDVLVERTNGTGLFFRGTRLLLERVTSRRNGQMGMGGGGVDCMLRDCTLLDNNVKGFPAQWEAGGIKVVHALRIAIHGMTAVGNGGPGIWYDIDNRSCEVTRCWAAENTGSGIFVEISGRGGMEVHENVCLRNGRDGNWAAAGILLGESMHCRVHHNLCADNATGIAIREQGPRTCRSREDRKPVTYRTTAHEIHHNLCARNQRQQFGLLYDNVFFGPHPSPRVGSRGTPLDPLESGLRLHHNLYWARPGEGLILWGCRWRPRHTEYGDLEAFQKATGLDAGSVVAEPEFVDPENGRFELKSTSPARRARAGRIGPARVTRPAILEKRGTS
jgi:hypothetical protein